MRQFTLSTLRVTGQWPRTVWQTPLAFNDLDILTEDLLSMKTYMCVICGFVYDEAKGLPDEGIEPGTLWDDVPLNWQCPECAAGKDDFEMMEI